MRFLLLGIASVIALASTGAHAAIITKTINFSASSFTTGSGEIPPYSTVTGSFTFTIDTTLTYANSSEITVNNLSIPYDGQVVFYYTPGTDVMQIGAAGNSLTMTGGTADFYLGFSPVSANEYFGYFSYSAHNFIGFADAGKNVIFDANPPAVPEPTTWAMMIGGLGLVGATMRRRKVAVSLA